jgi:hypothetical protein
MLVGQGKGRPFVLILVAREFHSRRLSAHERRNMSKRVNISVDLDALQAVLGEWPGVEEVVTQLGRPPHHIHTMLNDGRLKGIRTHVGCIIHPACVERVAREEDRSWEVVVESPKEEVGS